MPDDYGTYPNFRFQVDNANKIARRFANANADEQMDDLRRVVTNALWALEDLAAEGFSPAYLKDTVAGLIDGARDKLGHINKTLDAQGAAKRELDLSDELALLERCRAAHAAGLTRVPL